MLNACITSVGISGEYSDGVFSAGTQLLNGAQATGWARIRSTDQGDITRTERQRTVIADDSEGKEFSCQPSMILLMMYSQTFIQA